MENFNAQLDAISRDEELKPWEKISAAIGYHKAMYDRKD